MLSRAALALLGVFACGKPRATDDARGLADAVSLADAVDDAGPNFDASGGVDAEYDAAPIFDADPTAVTVTVLQFGSRNPAVGVPVAFVESNGALAAEMQTNTNGMASAHVSAGASVTVAYTNATVLATVLAVQPGDHLLITSNSPDFPTTKVGSFTVEIPYTAGVLSYDLVAPCGTVDTQAAPVGPTTVTFDVKEWCAKPTMDLIAIAHSSVEDTWDDLSGVAFADGGSATMSGSWKPMLSLTATFTNVSTTDVTSIDVMRQVPDEQGPGREVNGSAAPMTTLSLSNLAGAGTALMVTGFGGPTDDQVVYQVIDGTSTTYEIDASTDLLPWVDKPVVDPSSGAVHIPMSGPPAGAHLDTQLTYAHAGVTYVWDVEGPPETDFSLPPLPSDFTGRLSSGDTMQRASAFLQDATTIATWDDARAAPRDVFAPYFRGYAPVGARMRYVFNRNP